MRWLALAILLCACGFDPPPPPLELPPPPTPEVTPAKEGLTAAELLAMDEDVVYTAATGVLEDIEESTAPPPPAPVASPTPRSDSSRPQRRAAAPPRPSPTPRPYRFRGWQHGVEGFDEVADEHDQRHKTVVVYFHTDWCGWCRRLERDYFDSPRFARWLDRVPRVHINPEDGAAEREIADMFKVRGYPTFVVMPAGNTWYSRLHPFGTGGKHRTVDEFLAAVETAGKPK